MATPQRSKKSKRRDLSPARGRYWRSGKLARRKIKHLMQSSGFATAAEAEAAWLSVRKRFHGPGYKTAALA